MTRGPFSSWCAVGGSGFLRSPCLFGPSSPALAPYSAPAWNRGPVEQAARARGLDAHQARPPRPARRPLPDTRHDPGSGARGLPISWPPSRGSRFSARASVLRKHTYSPVPPPASRVYLSPGSPARHGPPRSAFLNRASLRPVHLPTCGRTLPGCHRTTVPSPACTGGKQ